MRSRSLVSLAVAGVAALAATSYATDPYPWGVDKQTSSGLVAYPLLSDAGATDATWYFPDGTVARQSTTSDDALTVTWHWSFPDGSFAEQTTTADGVPTAVTWYYLDGMIVRQAMMRDGTRGAITWNYPDGSLAMADAPSVITWYYPDGLIIDQHGSTYIVVQSPRVS